MLKVPTRIPLQSAYGTVMVYSSPLGSRVKMATPSNMADVEFPIYNVKQLTSNFTRKHRKKIKITIKFGLG